MIFSNGSRASIKKHMDFFKGYQDFSGHVINSSKSCFIMANSNQNRTSTMAATAGYKQGKFHIQYLGCPLYIGRQSPTIFHPFIMKIQPKLAGWKGKLLYISANNIIETCITSNSTMLHVSHSSASLCDSCNSSSVL